MGSLEPPIGHASKPLPPLWVFAVFGFLVADAVRLPQAARELTDPAAAWLAPWAPESPGSSQQRTSRGLARMNPRELRQLPGVGEGRARAIAVARWTHDRNAAALELDDVPGIGPITEQRVREWVEGIVAQTIVPHGPTDLRLSQGEAIPGAGGTNPPRRPRRSGVGRARVHSQPESGRRSREPVEQIVFSAARAAALGRRGRSAASRGRAIRPREPP